MADIRTSSDAAMAVAASALRAQQQRMRVIAENIANADSTAATPGADPYRKQTPVFATKVLPGGVKGVSLTRIDIDQTPFRKEYDPGNPAADAQGFVKMPNIEPMVETLDMREAQRAYDANISVIETARNIDQRTLDLIKAP
ncbi:MAG: flagellar basal body rod protein FlgC [Caulobacteraceae bacterium]